MHRQHTQCTAVQMMPLPALSPCTILPPLSIRGLFPSQHCCCSCGSTLTTAKQDCSQCQIHLGILQAECLVSTLKHITELNQSNLKVIVTTSQKWLSGEEKPYHILCESLKHFGDLESNCRALTKMFYKNQSSNFCCLYKEAQTEEKYLR